MTSQSSINVLTNRDYGPFRDVLAAEFFPAQSSRRLNLTYPRGDIAQPTSDIP